MENLIAESDIDAIMLCEKTMATNLEECEAMAAAARQAGKYLMIGLNRGLARAHVKAKEILDSGVMADWGVHKTDLFYYLTGKRAVRTFAVLATVDKLCPNGGLRLYDDPRYSLIGNKP